MNLSYCTGKHAGKPLRTLVAAIACSVAFLPASRVRAETYDFDAEFCLVRREICQEIVDTAKLIQPTYDARSTIWARFLMAGVSWQNRTLNWGNTSDIHLLVRKELPGINVDVEAIAAKHQTPEKTIYLLSIRGSDTFVDWVNNVRVRLVDFPYDEGKNAGVHRGFLEYAEALYDTPVLGRYVEEIKALEAQGQPYEVWLTGHSLGGATAVLMSAILHDKVGVPMENMTVVTFGAPSPGDRGFVDTYATDVVRAEIEGDPITLVSILAFPGISGGRYALNFGTVVRVVPSEERADEIAALKRELLFSDRDKLEVFKDILGLSIDIHQFEYAERFLDIFPESES